MLDSMERIADGMCILAERYIKDAGVDSVYYAGLGAETRWYTYEEFAKWIKPFDLKIMKAIKDAGGYCFFPSARVIGASYTPQFTTSASAA